MQHATKLFSVLLLASALGGCSMAGTGDYFSDKYANIQKTQMPQYWGETSGCNQQQQPRPTCGENYTSAPNQVSGHPYGAVASPAFGQPAQTYTGQPVYQSQNAFVGQPVYQNQNAIVGQPAYQGQPGFVQGGFPQGGFSQAEFGAAPYLNARSGNSRGLRQAYTYGSLGATIYDVDSDLFGIQGRLGWQSKSYFGAEVEGSFGISGEDNTAFDFGTGLVGSEADIDTQIAAFAVGRYPVSNRLNVLGRIGYHNTEFDVESTFNDGLPELEDDFSDDGLAYGAGVEYAINPRTSVRADYTIYDFDGPNGDAISLAVSRKF